MEMPYKRKPEIAAYIPTYTRTSIFLDTIPITKRTNVKITPIRYTSLVFENSGIVKEKTNMIRMITKPTAEKIRSIDLLAFSILPFTCL
jgi:hypothetical protein